MGGGWDEKSKYPKSEEEMRVFYCLALKIEKEGEGGGRNKEFWPKYIPRDYSLHIFYMKLRIGVSPLVSFNFPPRVCKFSQVFPFSEKFQLSLTEGLTFLIVL